MGKINFYTVRALFKGDPKDLTQLRDAQRSKLAQYKETGTFVLTMEADDKQPALVISWKGDADGKDYWKTVVKAPKQIKGTYAANAKAKSYAFTTDDPSKALLAEYLKLKGSALSIAVWNLLGPDANLLSINGAPLTRRALVDSTWEIAKWEVARVLVTNKALFDTAPIPGTKEVTQEGKKWHELPHGLLIPQDLSISVVAEGKMVAKAELNEQNAAYVRGKVADVFKPLVAKLGADLIKIDEAIGKEKAHDKKLKLVEQGNGIVEKFCTDASKAILASAQEQWIKLLEAKVDYRDFQVDMTIKVTRGVITLVISATAAGLGGITGVGAVLGLVGTIKGGLETANTVYTAFRNVDGMGNEINLMLANALASKNDAGWKDFGKTILGTLPGGKIVQSGLARKGLAVKPVKDIKGDLVAYNGKVSGLIKQASDLGKKVKETLAKSQAAINALETPAVKEIEKANPKAKTRNDLLRKNIGKATTEFLDKVGDLTRRFDEGKEKVEQYTKLTELLEKEVNKDVFATVLRDVFVPLLNLPWGINPENLASTIQGTSSVLIDVVTPVIVELTENEGAEGTAEWMKTANDLSKGIRELNEAIKKLHGG